MPEITIANPDKFIITEPIVVEQGECFTFRRGDVSYVFMTISAVESRYVDLRSGIVHNDIFFRGMQLHRCEVKIKVKIL